MATKKFKKKHNGFGDDLKDFFSQYSKYISAGVVLILLGGVIAGYSQASDSVTSEPPAIQTENSGDVSLQSQKFEVDAHEDVTALIKNYYEYYAKGDVDALEKIAYPISDTEKSYIKMFSKYVDKYENIKCYTKGGVNEGEYVASVSLDMKFKDIKTVAPGLDFFYIRTDEDGNCYIDNAYGEFNQSNQENTTDAEVDALVDEFEQDKDVIALQKEVQSAYNTALDSNSDLKTMVEGTVQDAITEWVASFGGSKTDDSQKQQTEAKQEDGESKNDDKKSDEGDTKSENTQDDGDKTKNEVKTRTIYAKTDINLRKANNTDSKILATIKKGAELTMYGNSKDGWCKVSYNDKNGYVMKQYVVFDKADLKNTKTDEKTRTIYAKTNVNMRKKASTDSDVLQTLKKGAELTMYGNSKDGWCKISYKNKTGYVMKKYVVFDKADLKETKKKEIKETKTDEKTRTIYAKTDVNMRKKASTDSGVLRTIKKGAKLTMYGNSKDGWCKVSYKDDTGYVMKKYIVTDKSKLKSDSAKNKNDDETLYIPEGKKIELSQTVNVRAAMNADSELVGVAYKGEVVTVIMSYDDGWTKVLWNDVTAYIKSEYLK